MSNTVIKVENVSKLYSLKDVGVATIKSDMTRFWAKMRGKEDPAFKLAEANDRASKGNSDFVWALKDINFEVEQGEVLGILGKNGAGKSTLLKILSRVAAPTTGQIKMKGRLASLLEVGTGFHPDLSGRENIFLNGSILGMTRAEIKKNFDEIVDFSGIERYIDTPVKRYSSGMYVRLAFAVSAYLESEILIIDEVLAVGDAEFQKKCLGKMKDVSGEGKTVLFVSHNILAIKSLCHNAILLTDGRMEQTGEVNEVINAYLSKSLVNSIDRTWDIDTAPGTKDVKLTKAKMIPQLEKSTDVVTVNTPLLFQFEFINYIDDAALAIAIELHTTSGVHIFTSGPATVRKLKKGTYITTCSIPASLLNNGAYTIAIEIVKDGTKLLHREQDVLVFEINDSIRPTAYTGHWPGTIRPRLNWTIDLLEKIF